MAGGGLQPSPAPLLTGQMPTGRPGSVQDVLGAKTPRGVVGPVADGGAHASPRGGQAVRRLTGILTGMGWQPSRTRFSYFGERAGHRESSTNLLMSRNQQRVFLIGNKHCGESLWPQWLVSSVLPALDFRLMARTSSDAFGGREEQRGIFCPSLRRPSGALQPPVAA